MDPLVLIIVIILVLWLLGASGTMALPLLTGNAVHLLLVILVVVVIVKLMRGERIL